ncbi:PEP-CTERM sorting domain-containing protein [Pontiella desulfatans]|uniref:PEP-CTERM sorting domain-containing protein n=1 Tax=Pontiella desulfatans TaxID=2750659 RepID=UPI0014445BDC|nr:PEP-CTERM sorting domain-containing protein [Pontiella desulfatans]
MNLVYSYELTNLDLDGEGDSADTMSWDVVFSAFETSTVASEQVTPGTQVMAAYDGTEFNVGAGSTTWAANESIQFSVDNIVLSDANYEATFDGFTKLWLTAGTYYLGTGADTTEFTTAQETYTFSSAQDVLVLTAQASERNRNLSGTFTVIPEPATLGLVVAFGGGIIFVRRRLSM